MLRVRNKLLSFILTPVMLLSLTTASGFANAVSPIATVTAFPAEINGYLPVGSYANGRGWGSIYTDGDVATGNVEKFLGGYEDIGATCGVLGGYVQFDMGENPITNGATNQYGVDFIVYGNSLGSNPEAGIAMVADEDENGDPDEWYELAGSLYYDDSTLHSQTITYIRVSETDETFDATGIWCSFDYAGSVPRATWWFMTASPLWWPEYEIAATPTPIPYYSRVVELDAGTVTAQGGGDYITWDRTSPYEIITYKNITVLDRNFFSGDFKFGYFDVSQNGTDYGIPVNPYAALGRGGDGFDLSWAVDASGNPVALTSVRFVRLYTGISVGKGGDISAEVSGLYTVSGGGSGGPTVDLEVYVDNATYDEMPTSNMSTETISVTNNSQNYDIYSDANNVYVNNEKVTTSSDIPYTLNIALTTSGQTAYYRIITQNGTESPYVTLLKFVRT
jgi:hypothetical protein